MLTGLSRGGAETQVFLLASGLMRRGWDVQVISLLPGGDLRGELEAAGIPVMDLSMNRGMPDPKAIWRLARALRRFRPNVLHAHMIHANLLARVVRLLVPVPVVVCTAQNTLEVGRTFRTERSTHLAYRLTDFLCDLTTQVSREGYARFLEGKAVRPDKLRFVPNAVDTQRFVPNPHTGLRLREELGIERDAFVWLAVGRLEEQKDYPILFQSFSQVVPEYPRVQLLVVGQGSLEKELRQLVESLGLQTSVRFLGLRKDVPDLMNAADAFVMSSAWEGMPMVLLEAHATGLPIVATNVGGIPDVVVQERTGFLVPPKDPTALAEAMKRLMGLPLEDRLKMGSEGRAWVVSHYSLDAILNLWEALYTSILAQKEA
ncbi:glycosyltransferase [Thermus altitudinis]|uniref:glycosyltransferase n=1 Tax=Thermus altitudinis TaxID=2908145 RepID=UPI001FA981FF